MGFAKRLVSFLICCCATLGAWAQPAGHLGVPGMQMIRSDFAPVAGLPAHHYYLLNVVHPDGTYDTMSSAYLAKQTLAYIDFVLILVRTSNSILANPQTGEIYLGDYDSKQKSQPLQDQMPLVRYTIPPNETRLVVRVSLPAGRAYSGYRQPVVINYDVQSVSMNARGSGYLLPN